MRRLILFAAIIAVFFAWWQWPRMGNSRNASGTAPTFDARAPATISPPSSETMANVITELRSAMLGPRFTPASCAKLLPVLTARLQNLPVVLSENESGDFIRALFEVRGLARVRLQEFGPDLGRNDSCLQQASAFFHAVRTTEDTIGDLSLHLPEDDDEPHAFALAGASPMLLLNHANEPFALRDGDVLMSRGTSFIGGAVARLGGPNSVFSSLDIVHVEPAGKKIWVIGSELEKGLTVRRWEQYADSDRVRVVVLRHQDAALAARAGAAAFATVFAAKSADEHQQPHATFFTADFIAQAFRLGATGSAGMPSKIPLRESTLRFPSRDWSARLHVSVDRAFEPTDLELDPHFDLIAEWRDLKQVHAGLLREAVLDAVFTWAEREGYLLRDEGPDTGFKRLVIDRLPDWPIFSVFLPSGLSAAMDAGALSALRGLSAVCDELFDHLELRSELLKAASTRRMSSLEMAAELEAYRREDLKVYKVFQKTHGYDPLAKRPDFHLLFH